MKFKTLLNWFLLLRLIVDGSLLGIIHDLSTHHNLLRFNQLLIPSFIRLISHHSFTVLLFAILPFGFFILKGFIWFRIELLKLPLPFKILHSVIFQILLIAQLKVFKILVIEKASNILNFLDTVKINAILLFFDLLQRYFTEDLLLILQALSIVLLALLLILIEIVCKIALIMVLFWVIFNDGIIHYRSPLNYFILVNWWRWGLKYLQHTILAVVDHFDAFNMLCSNADIILVVFVIFLHIHLRYGANEYWNWVFIINDFLFIALTLAAQYWFDLLWIGSIVTVILRSIQ